MSWAPISITPVPSRRSTARALRLEHQRRKGRRADAPADQEAVLVAHLPRRERPPRPAEALGALRDSIRASAFEENGLPEIGSTSA